MSKKILIVDDQEEVLEILQLYIEGSFDDVETIIASGGHEAIEILKTEEISSIVCDFRMPDGDGSLVFEFNENFKKLPFCWHSGTFATDIQNNEKLNKKHVFRVSKPSTEEDVCSTLSSMMALSVDVSGLRKVRISILKKIEKLDIDLYLKLSDTKKVLINSAGDLLPKEKFIDLETKGAEFLFVKKEDFDVISKNYWKQFDDKLNNAKNIEDIYFVVDDYIKGVQQDLNDHGIDTKLFEVGLKCANTCLKSLNKDEAIKLLLSGKIDRSNYIGNHSLLTVQVASLFVEDMELLELLAQAAIFHDLALTNERLAKISDSDNEYEKLTTQEKELVKNHPRKIVEILHGKDFLPEIKDIILNHHRDGRDGSWINNCGIIEVAFYVSHELAHRLSIASLDFAKLWLKNQEDNFKNSTYNYFYEKVKNVFGV